MKARRCGEISWPEKAREHQNVRGRIFEVDMKDNLKTW
jgi:hypothetical protein